MSSFNGTKSYVSRLFYVFIRCVRFCRVSPMSSSFTRFDDEFHRDYKVPTGEFESHRRSQFSTMRQKIASSASFCLIPTSYIKRKPPSITTPCLKLDLLSAIFSSCALHPILLTHGERFAKSKKSPCHQVKSVLWQSKMVTLASRSSGPTLFPNASTCMHVSNSDSLFQITH